MRHSLTEATRDVATRALQRWGERDLDGTLELIAEDVVHVLNIDGNLAPFAKSVAGKAELRPKLQSMLDALWFEQFDIVSVKALDTCARALITIRYRHRQTGEELATTFRMIMEVTDGLITLMEEYHDAAYVEAFLRLVSMEQREQTAPAVDAEK